MGDTFDFAPRRRGFHNTPTTVDMLAEPAMPELPKLHQQLKRLGKCKKCNRRIVLPCIACQATEAVEFKLAEKRRAIAVGKILADLPETACRVEGCDGKPSRRGLCGRCYANAAANVARGKTSWEELERLQIVLPKQPPRADSQFSKMLVKLREVAN